MENREALKLVVAVLNRAPVSQLESHGLQAAVERLNDLIEGIQKQCDAREKQVNMMDGPKVGLEGTK